MLVLNAQDVRRALPMRDAIDSMKSAFAALTSGRVTMPSRSLLSILPANGTTLVMPAYVDDSGEPALAVKVVSVFGENQARGIPTINAAVIVLEPDTGRTAAIVEGAALTAVRTAAGSGAATEVLARPDSTTLTVFGAGVQARSHIEAMCTVRPIEQVLVYDPSAARAEAMIEEISGRDPIPANVQRADSPADAVSEADIICTVTTSAIPVFEDLHLKAGVHLNAVGAYTPATSEIPFETVVRCRLFVDSREAAWQEAGEIIQPFEAGLIGRDHICAELGELLLGSAAGRTGPGDTTCYKSVGVAVQDAVAAAAVLRGARRLGLGLEVDRW